MTRSPGSGTRLRMPQVAWCSRLGSESNLPRQKTSAALPSQSPQPPRETADDPRGLQAAGVAQIADRDMDHAFRRDFAHVNRSRGSRNRAAGDLAELRLADIRAQELRDETRPI
jgi:hypothetical protein